MASLMAQMVKISLYAGDLVLVPGSGIAPGEGNATHTSRVSQDSKGNKQKYLLYKGDTEMTR